MIENSIHDVDKLKYNAYQNYIRTLDDEHENRERLAELVKDKLTDSEAPRLRNENEELKKQAQIKDDELQLLRDQISEFENQKVDNITQTEGQLTLLSEESQLYPKLTSILQGDETEKQAAEEALSNLGMKKHLDDEILRLDGKKSYIQDEIKGLEETEKNLKGIINGIQENFNSDAKVHTAKLFEAKLYTDLLNGIAPQNTKIKDVENSITSPNVVNLPSEVISTSKDYVSEIQGRLNEQGREIEFNDVANLIITIQQTFITIIAGASGVGKTSLIDKLAKSYGLNENFGFLDVACARGWTSSKDLIGFFNPLTNQFQPSKTKLKEALEKSQEYPELPYIVLLDEANLSPIEHYWSDFIKPADTDYIRKIKISDSEEIKYGNGFRFIATINNDHTTEPLSNRLIDRASIIQLQKGPVGENKDLSINEIYDFESSKNLFKKTKKWETDQAIIKDAKEKIKKLLEERGIIISNRKDILIDRYCEVATGFLEGGVYVALDYAVAQHILPLIRGRGEKLEKSLNDINSFFAEKGMEKSKKLLSQIIERGKEFSDYRYIYY